MSTAVDPESSTPVFLHVGCGPKRKERTPFASQNWREIRLDINSEVQPDVIGTMTDMKAVDDASVDAVRRRHVLTPVPGSAREARPLLFDFLLCQHVF